MRMFFGEQYFTNTTHELNNERRTGLIVTTFWFSAVGENLIIRLKKNISFAKYSAKYMRVTTATNINKNNATNYSQYFGFVYFYYYSHYYNIA